MTADPLAAVPHPNHQNHWLKYNCCSLVQYNKNKFAICSTHMIHMLDSGRLQLIGVHLGSVLVVVVVVVVLVVLVLVVVVVVVVSI